MPVRELITLTASMSAPAFGFSILLAVNPAQAQDAYPKSVICTAQIANDKPFESDEFVVRSELDLRAAREAWVKRVGDGSGNPSGVIAGCQDPSSVIRGMGIHIAFSYMRTATKSPAEKSSRHDSPQGKDPRGYEYRWMQNDRVAGRDMPVFASSIFPYVESPRGDRAGVPASNVRAAWLGHIRQRPGFKGGTKGGCGHARTYEEAKAAQDGEVSISQRSYSWAHRQDIPWSYGR